MGLCTGTILVADQCGCVAAKTIDDAPTNIAIACVSADGFAAAWSEAFALRYHRNQRIAEHMEDTQYIDGEEHLNNNDYS